MEYKLPIATNDLFVKVNERLKLHEEIDESRLDASVREKTYHIFEKMFEQFLLHLFTVKNRCYFYLQEHKNYDLVVANANQHVVNLETVLREIQNMLFDNLQAGKLPGEAVGHGDRNFMESNFQSNSSIKTANWNSGGGLPTNLLPNSQPTSTGSGAGGLLKPQLPMSSFLVDTGVRLKDVHAEVSKSPTSNFMSELSEFELGALSGQSKDSIGLPNVPTAKATTPVPLSGSLYTPDQIQNLLERTKLLDDVPAKGFDEAAFSQISFVTRDESIYDFNIFTKDRILKLNLGTGISQNYTHKLNNVLNFKRYKQFEIFAAAAHPLMILQNQTVTYVSIYFPKSTYHSKHLLIIQTM